MYYNKRIVFYILGLMIILLLIGGYFYFKNNNFPYKSTLTIINSHSYSQSNKKVGIMSNGDIITNDRYRLIKYTNEGEQVWEKTIYNELVYIKVIDNEVFALYKEFKNNSTSYVVYKLDNDGNVLWSKTISNELYSSIDTVTITSDKAILLSGSHSNENVRKAVVIKLDQNGEVEWQREAPFEEYKDDYGNLNMTTVNILETKNQTYIAVVQVLNNNLNGLFLEYNQQGELISTSKIYNRNWFINDVILTIDDHIVIAGNYSKYEQNLDAVKDYGFLSKYNTNGILVWEKHYNKDFRNKFNSLTETKKGDLIVVGEGINKNLDDFGIIVIYNSDGDVVSRDTLKPEGRLFFYDVIIDDEQSLYISSKYNSKNLIIKYELKNNILF